MHNSFPPKICSNYFAVTPFSGAGLVFRLNFLSCPSSFAIDGWLDVLYVYDCTGGIGASATCQAGSYNPINGITTASCQRCPIGTYTTSPNNATSCTACPTGLSSPLGSSSTSSCITPFTCPAGSYNVNVSASSTACELCPVNTFSTAGQLSDCISCYAGQSAPRGSAACVQASSGADLDSKLCMPLGSLATGSACTPLPWRRHS